MSHFMYTNILKNRPILNLLSIFHPTTNLFSHIPHYICHKNFIGRHNTRQVIIVNLLSVAVRSLKKFINYTKYSIYLVNNQITLKIEVTKNIKLILVLKIYANGTFEKRFSYIISTIQN